MYHRAAKYPKRVKIGPWNFWKIVTWTTLLVSIQVQEVVCFINNCHIFFPYELHGDLGLTTAFCSTKTEEKWSAFACFTRYHNFYFWSEIWSPWCTVGSQCLVTRNCLAPGNIWPDYCILIINHPTSLTIQANVMQWADSLAIFLYKLLFSIPVLVQKCFQNEFSQIIYKRWTLLW